MSIAVHVVSRHAFVIKLNIQINVWTMEHYIWHTAQNNVFFHQQTYMIV